MCFPVETKEHDGRKKVVAWKAFWSNRAPLTSFKEQGWNVWDAQHPKCRARQKGFFACVTKKYARSWASNGRVRKVEVSDIAGYGNEGGFGDYIIARKFRFIQPRKKGAKK